MKANFRIRRPTMWPTKAGDLWASVLSPIHEGISEDDAKARQLLTKGQAAVECIRVLDAEVHNGGIYQYFWNPSGNQTDRLAEALRLVGARPYLDLLKRVCQIFPEGVVPPDSKQRQKLLKKVPVERTEKLFDEHFFRLRSAPSPSQQLETRVDAYIRDHPDEFFLKEGEPEPTDPNLDPALWRSDYRIPILSLRGLRGSKRFACLIEPMSGHFTGSRKLSRSREFLRTLRPGQRALILIQRFDNLQRRGFGLRAWILFHGGLLDGLLSAYRQVGASRHAQLLNQVINMLPEEIRSEDSEVRRIALRPKNPSEEQLNAAEELFDAEMSALQEVNGEDVVSLLNAYIRAHKSEFFCD